MCAGVGSSDAKAFRSNEKAFAAQILPTCPATSPKRFGRCRLYMKSRPATDLPHYGHPHHWSLAACRTKADVLAGQFQHHFPDGSSCPWWEQLTVKKIAQFRCFLKSIAAIYRRPNDNAIKPKKEDFWLIFNH
jgi:hypothetical protein